MAYQDVNLGTALNDKQSIEFIKDLWDMEQPVSPIELPKFASYFVWLEQRINKFGGEQEFEFWDTSTLKVLTYGGLINLVDFVKERTEVARETVAAEMCKSPPNKGGDSHIIVNNPSKETIYKAIELAVDLWAMVAFHQVAAGEPVYHWHSHETLEEAIKNNLPPNQQPPKPRDKAPGKSQALNNVQSGTGRTGRQADSPEFDCDDEFSGFFTLYDMERLAGFKFRWTNNLLSHLKARKLREPGFTTTVFIFHHATILPFLDAGGPLPLQSYASEALKTLGLLFPGTESHCKRWFEKRVGKGIDAAAGDQPSSSSRVLDFCAWRSRLLTLEREFDNSAPRKMSQWWHDRRKRREWFPFWIALVVLILTVFSLILSLISASTGVISAQQSILSNSAKDSNTSSTDSQPMGLKP